LLKDNIEYTKEDIKELFFPDIEFKTYLKNYKYIMLFVGCDDGHKYCRFKTKEDRNSFLEECLTLNNASEIFNIEKENLLFETDN